MNVLAFCIGALVASLAFTFLYYGIAKDTTMTVCYLDGSWIKGIRKRKYINQETRGTHHFMVTEASDTLKDLIGKRVAIPINSVKYFIIERK